MNTEEKNIEWFGMKLSSRQKDKIRQLAKRRGVSQKKAVMDLIEKEFNEQSVETVEGSFYERNKDLIGVAEGPGDLSTNNDYMKGYGQ